MQMYEFYYKQIVTEGEMNALANGIQQAVYDCARDIDENGVFQGLDVLEETPNSTSVQIGAGVAKVQATGERCYNPILAVFACDQDEFGAPTYSDLLPGEGRWTSVFIRFKRNLSDPRVDGYGMPIWYNQAEGYEFFLHNGTKGLIANKDTLGRPGTITTAVRLADIWFESGSTNISAADIDYSRREDFYRQTVNGVSIASGSPKTALSLLGTAINGVFGNFADPDLPSGANDGAHKIGLGGHATLPEWSWEGGARFLTAPGDTVHDGLAKIVSDLGNAQAQGVSGGMLVSANTTPPDWRGAVPLGAHSGAYDGSVMGGIIAIVEDLAHEYGARKIGSPKYLAAAPYSLLNVDTIQNHLHECIDNLNDHVNTGGHIANAITYGGSAPADFADGVLLPAATVEQTFDTLVGFLGQRTPAATTAGTWKIGTSGFSGTYDGDIVIIPGNGTLSNQLWTMTNEIAARVKVYGDNRLAGDFIPKNDNAIALGDTTHHFNKLWTTAISSSNPGGLFIQETGGGGIGIASNDGLVFTGNGGSSRFRNSAGNTQIESSGGNVLIQTSGGGGGDIVLESNTGFISWYTGASKRAEWNGTALYPIGSNLRDLGQLANRWRQMYTHGVDVDAAAGTGRVDLRNGAVVNDLDLRTFDTYWHASAFQGYEWDWIRFNTSTGAFVQNTNDPAYAFIPVSELRVGMYINTMSALWMPLATATNLRMRLIRQSHSTGVQTVVATITSTVLAVHLTSGAVNHTVLTGYSYFLEVLFDNVNNQRLYSVSMNHNNPKWPL